MSPDERRLIVFNGSKWHVRRVRVVEDDLALDEKIYRCDEPLSNNHATLSDVPEVAIAIREAVAADRAALTAARDVLRRVEWINVVYGRQMCPWCLMYEGERHAPSCGIAAALRAVEERLGSA